MILTGMFISYQLVQFLAEHMGNWHTAIPMVIAILSTLTTGMFGGVLLGCVYLKQRKRLRGNFEVFDIEEDAFFDHEGADEPFVLSTNPYVENVANALQLLHTKTELTIEQYYMVEKAWNMLHTLSYQEQYGAVIDWEKECEKVNTICKEIGIQQQHQHLHEFSKMNHLLDLRYGQSK